MNLFRGLCITALLAFAGCSGEMNEAQGETTAANMDDARREALSKPPAEMEVSVPSVNARRGRILFVAKGCVIWQQVNEVGGTAAPPIDRLASGNVVDPLAFSARMWGGAPAMTSLQAIELGYIIDLDGQDIADLAAFSASKEEQTLLTMDSVPEEMRDWFLNTPYWRTDDWSEYMERGERIPLEEYPE